MTDLFVKKTPTGENAKWDDTSYCQFLDDGFHIRDLYERGRYSCMADNLTFSNLDLSVNVKMNHAAYVTFYLRGQAAPHGSITAYYVRVNASGMYSVQYNTANALGHTAPGVPWTFPDSRSLKPNEGNWNTVRIKLQGSNISLWFNGKSAFADKVPLLPSIKGIIGFGASTNADVSDQKPPLDVVFRDLTIYDLSKQ